MPFHYFRISDTNTGLVGGCLEVQEQIADEDNYVIINEKQAKYYKEKSAYFEFFFKDKKIQTRLKFENHRQELVNLLNKLTEEKIDAGFDALDTHWCCFMHDQSNLLHNYLLVTSLNKEQVKVKDSYGNLHFYSKDEITTLYEKMLEHTHFWIEKMWEDKVRIKRCETEEQINKLRTDLTTHYGI